MATRSGGKYRAWIRPFRHWWKPLAWIWGVLILGVIINDGSSWLITKKFDISGTPLGWGVDHPWITLLPLSLLVLLTLLARLATFQEKAIALAPLLTLTPEQRLRSIRKLQQVYTRIWTSSLQGKVALELHLQERTDDIAVSLVSHHLGTGEVSPLPSGTSIVQAYDTAEHGLLILGGPGSGKTTLLLELVQELLQRAENDPEQPIAIILNLSTWATTQRPLTQWLSEQCWLVYGIPKRLSAAWIAQEQVQFLLDGLNEVEAPARTACIEAINTYQQEHVVPLVMGSRSQEYLLQAAQVILPAAVEIQPLEATQVSQVLKRAGKSLAAVQFVLRNNATLGTLLTTPLMLNIVLLTYRDKTVKDLPQMGSLEEQQRQIFQQYVQHMLQRHQHRRIFSLAQTSFSLIWLAQQMQQHHLTEFHLESLQADWLSIRRTRITYRLFFGLFFGLFLGLFLGLFFGQFAELFGWPFGGLVGWLIGGLGGAQFGVEFAERTDIQLVEKVDWSWKRSRIGLVVGLVVGLVGGLGSGLVGGVVGGPFGGLVVGLLFGLGSGLAGGLSGVPLTEDVRLKPNQGIHTSGWNALRLGLLFFLFYEPIVGLSGGLGLFGGLVSRLFGELAVRLFGGLELFGWPFGGLVVGLLFGLLFGGSAYFQHYVLRLFLAQSRALPWRAVAFLEEAQVCILLQRVGGGYRFIHPLLQEYFASLTPYPTEP